MDVDRPAAYRSDRVTVYHGDCVDVMRRLPGGSVDAIVTDPPYALPGGFMSKEWDRHASPHAFQNWCQLWATEALRVLKPGGHMVAFGGTRTSHRLVCGIEDAGFEIRDSLVWLYGSGFPKSLDVSKAIDKAAGAEREVVGHKGGRYETWQGWGTALKPAHEPIVLARKPLAGTVAGNVLAHGTGALNIDGCRIAHTSEADRAESVNKNRHADFGTDPGGNAVYGDYSMVPSRNYDGGKGRWPANVTLDEDAATLLNQQTGETTSNLRTGPNGDSGAKDTFGLTPRSVEMVRGHIDSGGASRFFYTAKAPSTERIRLNGTAHPTVKNLSLMRWLVRLITPPGGTILDPFAGSGTTIEAAILEGFHCIAIERETDYLPLIRQRINRKLNPAATTPNPDQPPDLFTLLDLP